MTTDQDNEIADHTKEPKQKKGGPDWDTIAAEFFSLIEDIRQMIKPWEEKNRKWRIETMTLNYPPRMFISCYLVETNPLRKEEHFPGYGSAAAHLSDAELDELTSLITPIIDRFKLRCRKQFARGSVQYILQPQFKE